MEEHYDESLALFRGFLDPHYMAYTMAWYGEDPQAVRDSEADLVQAQAHKFALAAERIGLQGDERVLNIGCGFGPLETWLFEHHPGLRLVSLTPSRVQADYIRRCMADPAHIIPAGRIRLLEKTFDQLEWQDVDGEAFDLVFAVGVFEHIADLEAAFDKIHEYLKPGGRCFLHLIVSRPVFPERYMDSENTLIGRYFPGGRIWPYEALPRAAGRLELSGQWYLNGMNYWRTLDEWHRRYWEHMPSLYPAVLDAGAVKHWNDYFVLCKAVLFGPMEGEVYGNAHYVFRRPS
ncbi:MAG TPA: methyltransferase domain-containing protein [Gammaproteobacteria bacterium]|nr:methyltransferase domain-containing protein [Gammaproteobacteria bacterium]